MFTRTLPPPSCSTQAVRLSIKLASVAARNLATGGWTRKISAAIKDQSGALDLLDAILTDASAVDDIISATEAEHDRLLAARRALDDGIASTSDDVILLAADAHGLARLLREEDHDHALLGELDEIKDVLDEAISKLAHCLDLARNQREKAQEKIIMRAAQAAFATEPDLAALIRVRHHKLLPEDWQAEVATFAKAGLGVVDNDIYTTNDNNARAAILQRRLRRSLDDAAAAQRMKAAHEKRQPTKRDKFHDELKGATA